MNDQRGLLSAKLIDLFDTLYLTQRLGGKSPVTVRHYRYNLRHLDRYLKRPALASDLTDEMLCGAMQALSDRGRCAVTVNKLRHHVLALWRFLARKRIVEAYPDVPTWPEPERVPLAWSRPEIAALWKACATTDGTISGIPAADWWLALHGVLWDSAERIGAVLALRWTETFLDDGLVIFRSETRKGGRRFHKARLHPDTVAALRRIQEPERLRVFPWDRCDTTIYLHYSRLLKRAGLSRDRWSKFHKMRRTVASFFEAAGGDAQKLLGHSSRKVTECYLDPRVVVTQSAADLLFRPDQPQNPDPPRAA